VDRGHDSSVGRRLVARARAAPDLRGRGPPGSGGSSRSRVIPRIAGGGIASVGVGLPGGRLPRWRDVRVHEPSGRRRQQRRRGRERSRVSRGAGGPAEGGDELLRGYVSILPVPLSEATAAPPPCGPAPERRPRRQPPHGPPQSREARALPALFHGGAYPPVRQGE
jgi:hypothetical protein